MVRTYLVLAAMFLATTVDVARGAFVSTSYDNRSWVEVTFERREFIPETGEQLNTRVFSYGVPFQVTSLTVTADETSAAITDIKFDAPTIIPAQTFGDSYPGGFSDVLEIQSITVPKFAFSRSTYGQYFGTGADRFAYPATGIIVPPMTLTGIYHLSGPTTTKSLPFTLQLKTNFMSSTPNEEWTAQSIFINDNQPLTDNFPFKQYNVAGNYGPQTVFFDEVDGATTVLGFLGMKATVNFFVPEPATIGGAMAGLALICSVGRRSARKAGV